MSGENQPEVVAVDTLTATAEREAADPEPVDVPGVWMFVRPLLGDVGLPTAAYYLTRAAGGHAFASLLAATATAGLRVVYVAARSRRLDVVAAFLLALFGIGLATSFVAGSPRLLIAKDSIPTAVAGLIFLGTCVAGRPLAYAWGKRMMATTATEERRWTMLWNEEPLFRRTFYVISLAWGGGLLLEAALRLALVDVLPVDVLAGLSSVVSVVAVTALAVWTVWYARWVQR